MEHVKEIIFNYSPYIRYDVERGFGQAAEDRRSLQLAYMKLAQQVAAGKIDPTQARVVLRVLESAGRNLPDSDSSEASIVERRFPGI